VPAALEVTDLGKSFGGNVAVDGVSFALERGRVTGLIGANGAGKTTVLNIVSGVTGADRGSVSLGGVDVTRTTSVGRSRLGLTRTFQHPRLVGRLSVFENVMLGAHVREAGARDLLSFMLSRSRSVLDAERATRTLGTVGYSREKWARRCEEIPSTEHRWVELARSIACGPSVVLLDEPTSGFTKSEVTRFFHLIQRLASDRNVGVLLVTHDVSLAARACDALIVMDRGRLLATGDSAAVMANPKVANAYLGEKAGALLRATPPGQVTPQSPSTS
jgi:ABC-type branched-subunit amino acid transport system ATPase component